MGVFLRLRVSKRLGLAFALVGLACVFLLALSYFQQRRVDVALDDLGKVEFARLQEVMKLKAVSEGLSARLIALNASKDPIVARTFGPEVGARVAEITTIRNAIREWTTSPEEQAWSTGLDGIEKSLNVTLDEVTKVRQSGDDVQAERIFNEAFLPAVKAWDAQLDQLVGIQSAKVAQAADEMKVSGWRHWWMGGAMGALLLAVGTAIIVNVARTVVRSLKAACDVAAKVADGDLAVELETRGHDEFAELNRAIAAMAAGLRSTVQHVRDSAEHIATASQEIAQGTMNLSERTELQAGHLQKTASTMDQMAAMVGQTAETAVQMNDLSRHARGIAEQSAAAVSRVIGTMTEIEQSAKRVQEIIGVIDGIFFQTNILALNAAVEAARAGELGDGFAVVAGEVRQLAQRSAEAAKEIRQLIAESSAKVQIGATQVQEAGRTMGKLQSSVQQVTTKIGEIAEAAVQQGTDISGVSQAVAELDRATQENSALVEESAAAAASLREQAASLAEQVARFRLQPDGA